ncbi:MAG: hypothetical protein ACK5PP_02450, partial [Acidimicrobiales bacterium]
MIPHPAPSAVFVSSAGGVLLDALAVAGVWTGPVRWIAVDAPDARERLHGCEVEWVGTEPAAADLRALAVE